MRLLWVNHFAVTPREPGGTRHFELSRELVRSHGWRVTVAASDFHLHTRTYTRRSAKLETPVAEQLEGVDFTWLWAAHYTHNNWKRAWNWLSFARSLARWTRSSPRADLVIGSSPHLFASLASQRAAKRWGVPFVMEVRDLWPESLLAAGGRKGPAYHALGAIARYLYGRAERIIVLSRGSERHLRETGIASSKLVYVPNGVDVGAFHPQPRPARSTFTAIYTGAHGPANGLDVVLEAAALLRERTDIRFLLVGDGPTKAALQLAAAQRELSNVEFHCPVSKDEVPALLQSADAGLMVLRDSPLFAFGVSPNKLFDYFAAELPVVCNVPGEVAGMLSESEAGVQASGPSARALADAVLALAARPGAQRAAMGRAGRAWVQQEHSRKVLAARIDRALRAVLDR